MNEPNIEVWGTEGNALGIMRVEMPQGRDGPIGIYTSDRTDADCILLGVPTGAPGEYELYRGRSEGNGPWPRPRVYDRRVGTCLLNQLDQHSMSLVLVDYRPEPLSVSPIPPPINQTFVLGKVAR